MSALDVLFGGYGGLLGPAVEAADIQKELDCSCDEAKRIQGERQDARTAAYEAEKAAAEQAEALPLIMQEQGCTVDEAKGFFRLWKEMEAEAAARKAGPPSAVILQFRPRGS